MRLPFLGIKRDDPVSLPLPEAVHVGFGVYFRGERGSVPGADDLKPVIRAWLADHTTDPLHTVARDYLDRGWLEVQVGSRDLLPSPPMDLLRYLGAGEAEEQRYEGSTHLAVVSAPDAAVHVRAGLWTALGAARAVAEQFSGVILDPELPRLEPVESYGEPLPADAGVRITEQIIIPFSVDERGLGWMTTKGMGKLGLPDLEIRDVPPNLASALTPVMNGMARHLARAVVRQAMAEGQPSKQWVIGPELRLGLEDLADDGDEPSPADPPEGVRGWTTIRLEYREGRRGQSSFLRLVPPRGFRRDQGVWLNTVLIDLFGTEDTMVQVEADSEAMEAAHLRAVAELPAAKQRFQAGLRPGEVLHIKHGFPTGGEGHEYMWIAINRWSGDSLRGQLANDPQVRLDLRSGQTVELRESDIFDWMISGPGDQRTGGYTIAVTESEGRR
jgi:uncharacterized protein YegJ (DUF2314 family)